MAPKIANLVSGRSVGASFVLREGHAVSFPGVVCSCENPVVVVNLVLHLRDACLISLSFEVLGKLIVIEENTLVLVLRLERCSLTLIKIGILVKRLSEAVEL